MRFVTFKGEKSIGDLVNRVFRIQGRGAQAASKQAADALLQANPQLKDISKVPVGSLIAIPDTAPPVVPEEAIMAVGLVRSSTIEDIQSALNSLEKGLSAIEATALDRIQSLADRFQAPEVKKGIKAVAGANADLMGRAPSVDSIAKDTKEVLKAVQTTQEAHKQTLTQLRASLANLKG